MKVNINLETLFRVGDLVRSKLDGTPGTVLERDYCAVKVEWIDGQISYFPRRLVEESIERIPRGKSYTMTPIEQCPEYLQQLKYHVDGLYALLSAPEPGLLIWHRLVQQYVKAISDLWPYSSTVSGGGS